NDVSHDFQTPLQNIKGYAALLQDPQTTSLKRREYSKIIESETDRLSVLTKQLLLLTSLDSLENEMEMTPVRLDEQLKATLRRYRWLMEEKDISLTADIKAITVQGNAAYLEKVWENILSNALKYTPSDGEINISMKETETKAVISVQDNGIGITEENIPYLFERFYRVDEARNADIEGTGLGLSIAKEVVELHGGDIKVKSKVGKGTVFSVRLPK